MAKNLENQNPPKDTMWLAPLGGVGEIGKNMMVLHYKDEILIIDAGLMFPKEDMYGVDLVIPDISYLIENKDKIKGIILTHGHEDHIGALPYILNNIDAPIYGTKLTLAILKSKLREFDFDKIELIEFSPDDKVAIGSFRIDTFRVVHSITEGIGLAIETPFGMIIHSGDFKFDDDPIDGKTVNKEKLRSFGDKGVFLLLSDSTYAERWGHSAPEKDVGRTLEEIFSQCPGRIIITSFASSIPRIQQIIDCTKKAGRKIAFVGRSLVNNVNVTKELGFLKIPHDITFKIENIDKMKDKDVVMLTTGSQGEPMSVLTLMATNNYKWITIKSGDTVIISATPVPGNEMLVNNTVNLLFKQGANVIYNYATMMLGSGSTPRIHVSGHANREELEELFALVRPKHFIPIHGEYRHLVQHSNIAKGCGIDKDNIFLIENGDIVHINKDGIKVDGKIMSGEVLIDGLGIGDIGKAVLRDRKHLSNDGICMVVATVDRSTGELLSGPEVISRGFVYFSVSKEMMEKSKELAREIFNKAHQKQLYEITMVKNEVREVLTKFFQKQIKRRPMIVPVILEV
ncbi:MAG: ribonuclease J [Armatimonadota bacterium]